MGPAKAEMKRGASPLHALDPDATAMCLHDRAADEQAQSGAFDPALPATFEPAEPAEQPIHVGRRDADAISTDPEHAVALGMERAYEVAGEAVGRCVGCEPVAEEEADSAVSSDPEPAGTIGPDHSHAVVGKTVFDPVADETAAPEMEEAVVVGAEPERVRRVPGYRTDVAKAGEHGPAARGTPAKVMLRNGHASKPPPPAVECIEAARLGDDEALIAGNRAQFAAGNAIGSRALDAEAEPRSLPDASGQAADLMDGLDTIQTLAAPGSAVVACDTVCLLLAVCGVGAGSPLAGLANRVLAGV